MLAPKIHHIIVFNIVIIFVIAIVIVIVILVVIAIAIVTATVIVTIAVNVTAIAVSISATAIIIVIIVVTVSVSVSVIVIVSAIFLLLPCLNPTQGVASAADAMIRAGLQLLLLRRALAPAPCSAHDFSAIPCMRTPELCPGRRFILRLRGERGTT